MEHGHSGYTLHKCRCPVCSKAAADYQRVYQVEYRRKNKEKKLAYYREWREQNRDKVLAKGRTSEGKLKKRKHLMARRAREREQFVEVVNPKTVYQMHGGCCGICKGFVSQDAFEVDHVIPVALGGLHCYANVQPSHASCNRRKWASLPSAA